MKCVVSLRCIWVRHLHARGVVKDRYINIPIFNISPRSFQKQYLSTVLMVLRKPISDRRERSEMQIFVFSVFFKICIFRNFLRGLGKPLKGVFFLTGQKKMSASELYYLATFFDFRTSKVLKGSEAF